MYIGYVATLYTYDPAVAAWALLSPGGAAPSPRDGAVAVTPDGQLYVWGGYSSIGDGGLCVPEPGLSVCFLSPSLFACL